MLLNIEVWSNIPVFLYWCICLCVHVCEYVYVHMSSRKSSEEQHGLVENGFLLGKGAKC